jgi:hypothetical protein
MATFIVMGHGRMRGAIGITHGFSCEVEAEDEEDARLRIYDHYEHIAGGSAGVRVTRKPPEHVCSREMDGTCHVCGAPVEG